MVKSDLKHNGILYCCVSGLHVAPAFSQAIVEFLPPHSSAIGRTAVLCIVTTVCYGNVGGAALESAQELVQLFQDNSHCQLALCVVVQVCLCVCARVTVFSVSFSQS